MRTRGNLFSVARVISIAAIHGLISALNASMRMRRDTAALLFSPNNLRHVSSTGSNAFVTRAICILYMNQRYVRLSGLNATTHLGVTRLSDYT